MLCLRIVRGTFKQKFIESIKTVILNAEEISLVIEYLPSAYEVLRSTSRGPFFFKIDLREMF